MEGHIKTAAGESRPWSGAARGTLLPGWVEVKRLGLAMLRAGSACLCKRPACRNRRRVHGRREQVGTSRSTQLPQQRPTFWNGVLLRTCGGGWQSVRVSQPDVRLTKPSPPAARLHPPATTPALRCAVQPPHLERQLAAVLCADLELQHLAVRHRAGRLGANENEPNATPAGGGGERRWRQGGRPG